jgi:glyoxylase-like metal-dependent hydrolase (beta-lactamase superfamily II)
MPSTKLHLSRRSLMLGASALPLGAALSGPLQAAAELMGPSVGPFSRFRLGGFDVTTLLAGTRTVPEPNTIFGLNATPEAFAEAAAEANIPTDRAQFFFTPTVVNTGRELVLFDTGLAAEATQAALTAAGYSPEQVDIVVITHMHGDHIGGLMAGDAPAYPNASYITGATEFDSWASQNNEAFEKNMRPVAEKTKMIGDGEAVVSGVTSMLAPGHTAGHMAYVIESDGQTLLLTADTTNHYAWSLARPDWEVSFDADKAQAAATRRKVLGMLAADKLPFIGYHMPFPALGYVEADGDGFRYVPASYQLILE